MTKRRDHRLETALDTAGAVIEAAGRAEHAARRLLRRTRVLARRASHHVSAAPADATPLPPPRPVVPAPETPPADERERQIADLRAQVERAEHAASWLRVRLRAERRRKPVAPPLDAAAIAADITRDLARGRAYHHEAVRAVVLRVFAAHGLPVAQQTVVGARAQEHVPVLVGWTREQQEALATRALALQPEISDPTYVFRALALVGQHGRSTLPDLLRASALDSPMARRRLRLACEALRTLGAFNVREGSYTLAAARPPLPHDRGPAVSTQRGRDRTERR